MADIPLENLQAGWDDEDRVIAAMNRLCYIVAHRGRGDPAAGHGPRLHVPRRVYAKTLSIPDIECLWPWYDPHPEFNEPPPCGLPRHFFLDTKGKSRCTYYRTNKRWQSGIDEWCYETYGMVQRLLWVPVWVAHLIRPASEEAMDRQQVPPEKRPSPTGLYVHPIDLANSDSGN